MGCIYGVKGPTCIQKLLRLDECIKAHYTPKKTGFEPDYPKWISDRFRAARLVSGNGTSEEGPTTLFDAQCVKVKAGTNKGPITSF